MSKRESWTENGIHYSQYGWKRDRRCPKHGCAEFTFRDSPDDWLGCERCAEEWKNYKRMCDTNQ